MCVCFSILLFILIHIENSAERKIVLTFKTLFLIKISYNIIRAIYRRYTGAKNRYTILLRV